MDAAIPIGVTVLDDLEYDHATGVVVDPDARQLAEGRELLRDDLGRCVLVHWSPAPGFRSEGLRWEYAEDLHVVAVASPDAAPRPAAEDRCRDGNA